MNEKDLESVQGSGSVIIKEYSRNDLYLVFNYNSPWDKDYGLEVSLPAMDLSRGRQLDFVSASQYKKAKDLRRDGVMYEKDNLKIDASREVHGSFFGKRTQGYQGEMVFSNGRRVVDARVFCVKGEK